jgi:methylglyoxal synthase
MSAEILPQKRIALVAHDSRKAELLMWVRNNLTELQKHQLFATGTTGNLIHTETGLNIQAFKSGPLGGDQQIGARIAEGTINFLIFFWDPLQPQPHDPDVKALLRLAVLYNIPTASNLSTADFLFNSKYMEEVYPRYLPDYLEILREIRERDVD